MRNKIALFAFFGGMAALVITGVVRFYELAEQVPVQRVVVSEPKVSAPVTIPTSVEISTPKCAEKTIVVRKGDWLSKISLREYGDKRLYNRIVVRNGIKDPDFITVGQKLVIPCDHTLTLAQAVVKEKVAPVKAVTPSPIVAVPTPVPAPVFAEKQVTVRSPKVVAVPVAPAPMVQTKASEPTEEEILARIREYEALFHGGVTFQLESEVSKIPGRREELDKSITETRSRAIEDLKKKKANPNGVIIR